jgi:hypothetical protein
MVPSIRNLLELAPLGLQQWGLIFGVALTLLVIVEIGKLINNRRRRPVANPIKSQPALMK